MTWIDEDPPQPWVKVLKDEQLGAGEMRLGRVGIRQVVVTRSALGIRIFRNLCPHAGAPLSGGKLTEDSIVCPRHSWEFRLHDGHCPAHPIYTLRAYNVKVEDGWVFAQEQEEEIW